MLTVKNTTSQFDTVLEEDAMGVVTFLHLGDKKKCFQDISLGIGRCCKYCGVLIVARHTYDVPLEFTHLTKKAISNGTAVLVSTEVCCPMCGQLFSNMLLHQVMVRDMQMKE